MARRRAVVGKQVVASVRAYRRALRAAGIPVTQLVLFGSRAKGRHHRWSDIDLAVVSPAFRRNRSRVRTRLLRLRAGPSLFVEPHPFHPAELKDRWNSLAAEVRKHGVPIR